MTHNIHQSSQTNVDAAQLKQEYHRLLTQLQEASRRTQQAFQTADNFLYDMKANHLKAYQCAQSNELSQIHQFNSSSALLYNYLSILDQGRSHIQFKDHECQTFELEKMLPILNRTYRKANIDAIVYSDQATIFIESKFLEPIDCIVNERIINNSYESYLDDNRYLLKEPFDRFKLTLLFKWLDHQKCQCLNIVQLAKHIAGIYTHMKTIPTPDPKQTLVLLYLTWEIKSAKYAEISRVYQLIKEEFDTIHSELVFIVKEILGFDLSIDYMTYREAISHLGEAEDESKRHKNFMKEKYLHI